MTSGDTALVTGASSGIGEAYAEALAARGMGLVLVARREDRLHGLATRLRKAYGVAAELLPADLANSDDLARVEETLNSGAVDLLLNNAGFGAYMAFADLPVDRAEELLRVKVVASTRLARAALPSMLTKGSGTVINVASMLGFSAAMRIPQLPLRVTYAAANAYLIAFTQLLLGEVGGRGIRVQALCPALVKTEFHLIQGRDMTALPNVMEAADIVKASLAGLGLGEVICAPTVGDPALIGAWQDSATAVFAGSRGALAERYRASHG